MASRNGGRPRGIASLSVAKAARACAAGARPDDARRFRAGPHDVARVTSVTPPGQRHDAFRQSGNAVQPPADEKRHIGARAGPVPHNGGSFLVLRPVQRILVVLGLALLAAGLLWPWLSRLPWGRLPGDIRIERDGFTFFAPITTAIVVSIVVSVLLWWWRR